MNPGQVARAFFQMIELRLLAGPEDAEGEKAHAIGDPLRAQSFERYQQFALAVHLRGRGNVHVQHQQRHGHGKDAVAQGGQAFEAASLNPVVKSHPVVHHPPSPTTVSS